MFDHLLESFRCLLHQVLFDHLLETSRLDDSNKWSNIGFGEEIDIIELKIHTLSGALLHCFKGFLIKTLFLD